MRLEINNHFCYGPRGPLTLGLVIFWGGWEICQRPGIHPLIAHDLADQKAWIIAALKNIDAPMLMCVWQEPEYRIDVCRVTRGAHIEHL